MYILMYMMNLAVYYGGISAGYTPAPPKTPTMDPPGTGSPSRLAGVQGLPPSCLHVSALMLQHLPELLRGPRNQPELTGTG